jgi:hypothetical protein
VNGPCKRDPVIGNMHIGHLTECPLNNIACLVATAQRLSTGRLPICCYYSFRVAGSAGPDGAGLHSVQAVKEEKRRVAASTPSPPAAARACPLLVSAVVSGLARWGPAVAAGQGFRLSVPTGASARCVKAATSGRTASWKYVPAAGPMETTAACRTRLTAGHAPRLHQMKEHTLVGLLGPFCCIKS